jgi:hypothetical protein
LQIIDAMSGHSDANHTKQAISMKEQHSIQISKLEESIPQDYHRVALTRPSS